MKHFTIYGASDDLIEIEGCFDDELNAYEANPAQDYFILGRFDGDVCEVGVCIAPVYTANGVWLFAIGMIDEEIPTPDQEQEWGWVVTEQGYTQSVKFTIPDDFNLQRVGCYALDA